MGKSVTIQSGDPEGLAPPTRLNPPGGERKIRASGEMADRVRELDWSRTALGPIANWTDALVVLVNMVLENQHQMLLFWGEDLTQFYNDAAISIVGPDKHPEALGQSARTAWAEVWPIVGPQIEAAQRGEACRNVDQLVPVRRNGKLCDAWFTYSYSPVRDAEGAVSGVLVNCIETTERMLAEKASREERGRLLSAFRQAPAFFALLRGPEHVFEMTNPAYQRVIGRDVLGRTVREAVPEVVEQGFIEILDGVYRTGIPFIGQGMHILLDPGDGRGPRTRRLDFVYQPLREAENEISGILVFGIDITERTLTEEQLREERERFDFATAAANIGYWFCDLPFDKLTWDERVKEHFWLPPDAEVDIDLFYRLLHPEDLEPTRKAMEASIENHTTYDVEYRTLSPQGEQKWIRAIGRTAYDSEGKPLRFDGVTLDISPLKSAQEARGRAEEALIRSEKLAVVGRLAATISHEINNPLESVMNLLYLIHSGAKDEASRTYSRLAQDELARVAHIVTHTLRFNRQTLSAARGTLEEVLDSAAAIYEARLRHAGIRVSRDFAPETRNTSCALEMRQVFANLIGNAFDASEPGGRLALKACAQRNWKSGAAGIRVTVADTGSGMDAVTRRRLYEPFFSTKGEQGTGLGLWVSREILQKNGATIRVKSSQQPGRSGTVFSVWLPALAGE